MAEKKKSKTREFKDKKEALAYCFTQIKQSKIGSEDYNKLKQYMYRHKKGLLLKDTAIKTLFNYFGVKEVCTYMVEEE